jgi:hypothetical protein
MLMRLSLIVAIFAVVTSAGAADIKPTDSSNPLFRILKFQTLRGGDHPQVSPTTSIRSSLSGHFATSGSRATIKAC